MTRTRSMVSSSGIGVRDAVGQSIGVPGSIGPLGAEARTYVLRLNFVQPSYSVTRVSGFYSLRLNFVNGFYRVRN